MKFESKLECKNLKIKLLFAEQLDLDILKDENIDIVERKTCYILKRLKSTITIYKHSQQTLHVTGLTSAYQLDEFMKYIQKKLNQKPIEYKVDNSMFSCKLKNDIELKRIIHTLPIHAPYYCAYTNTIFPALFLKPKKQFKEMAYPTILLFRNGSFLLLGAKQMRNVKKAANFVKNLLNKSMLNHD